MGLGRKAQRLLRRVSERLHDWFFSSARFDRARIEPEVIADICALARGSYPKEMIAFLTGAVRQEGTERVLVIDGLYVKGYDANENSTFFTTHDLPMIGVQGTVHSHPSGNVRASGADRQLFAKHGWFHLIIGRPYTRETIASYDKYGERIDTIEF